MLRYRLSVGGLKAQTIERIGVGLEANLEASKFQAELGALLRVQGYVYASALSVTPRGECWERDHQFWRYEVEYATDDTPESLRAHPHPGLTAQDVCEAAEQIETGVLEALKVRERLALLAPEPDDIPY